MPEILITKPFIALLLIALSCSMLGVFVLFKKLAYFADASAHSLMLALALGFWFSIAQNFALIIFAIFFAIFVFLLSKNRYFSKDTIIAISSYSCIALALLINDLNPEKIDFESYIFGDISLIQNSDLKILAIIAIATAFFTILSFNRLILVNLNQDLAKINNINVNFLNATFLILLSIIIAIAIKLVGIFLITALLILPAAISRLISSNPKQMLFLSIILSILVCILSNFIATSYFISLAPTTIFAFCTIFIAINLFKKC